MSSLGNRSGNPLFLSHKGTCCIYQSDLKILDSDSEWLNDSCINFQMIRLSEKAVAAAVVDDVQTKQRRTTVNKNGKQRLPRYNNNNNHDDGADSKIRVVFMDPCIVSFFMHQISVEDEEDRDEIVGLFKNTWELDSCQTQPKPRLRSGRQREDRMVAMMIPINDNHAGSSWSCQTPGAGNHWSLLVVLIDTEDLHDRDMAQRQRHRQRSNYARYFHLDSSRHGNSAAAKTVATRVESILSIGVSATATSTTTTASACAKNKTTSKNKTNSKSKTTTTAATTATTNAHDNIIDLTGDESDTQSSSNEATQTPSPSPTPEQPHRTSLKRMATSVGVVECSTPQQSNGHDCGLCTLANAEALSGAIDAVPRRRGSEGEVTGDGGRNGEEDDDKKLKKWIELTLKEFVGEYGGMSKMTRSIRRKIAADVRQLKVSSG